MFPVIFASPSRNNSQPPSPRRIMVNGVLNKISITIATTRNHIVQSIRPGSRPDLPVQEKSLVINQISECQGSELDSSVSNDKRLSKCTLPRVVIKGENRMSRCEESVASPSSYGSHPISEVDNLSKSTEDI